MSKRHHTYDDVVALPRDGIILKDGRIHFWEARGEVHFGFFEVYRRRELRLSCCVPKDIREQGADAIRAHATTQVRAWRTAQRAAIDRFDAYAAHPDFPIITTHCGVTLKGRIISAANSTLRVRLEEPYTGERHVEYRWTSAMAGHYIFTETDEFTKDAIASAKRLLAEIFDEAAHRKNHRATIELAEQLNHESQRLPSP